MKLGIVTAHAGAACLEQAVYSWKTCEAFPWIAIEDGTHGMLPAYQNGLTTDWLRDCDILAFLHDDTIINDKDWVFKVQHEFEDPAVGLVGFGGALGHGSPTLYREPYDYHQLARQDFMSNMEDAENHGRRFDGACDVAVLDGFALIVRRELLEKMGGWPLSIPHDWHYGLTFDAKTHEPAGRSPVRHCIRCRYREDSPNIPPCPSPIGYIAYDYWICCMTRRLGYRIRLLGIPCRHIGGQTFVKLNIGNGPQHWEKYLEAHKYIYDEFKDVLPFYVVKR